MVRLIVIVVLVVLLSACSGNPLTPTGKLVKKALALQVEQTQQQLSKQLEVSIFICSCKKNVKPGECCNLIIFNLTRIQNRQNQLGEVT